MLCSLLVDFKRHLFEANGRKRTRTDCRRGQRDEQPKCRGAQDSSDAQPCECNVPLRGERSINQFAILLVFPFQIAIKSHMCPTGLRQTQALHELCRRQGEGQVLALHLRLQDQQHGHFGRSIRRELGTQT